MTDIRRILEMREPYWWICREERNFAALLYHLLLCGDNLRTFCQAVGYQRPITVDSAVYFEYAYLRDIWSRVGEGHTSGADLHEANWRKRQVIVELLQPSQPDYLMFCEVHEFNRHFGAIPKPSVKFIQSPGTWSVSRFCKTIPDSEEFLRTCMFKWSFNAKPDIVIHADLDHALCIEAKLVSKEGQYPTTSVEKAIFKELGLRYVSQTQLQKYLMEELLGIETEYLMLVQELPRHATEQRMITWAGAFGALDHLDQPSFVNAWSKGVQGLG